VLHEDGKKPQSKSYMWLYRTSGDATQPIVLYDYKPDRKAERPKGFLKGFHGYLHADGYSGYHNLPAAITVVGCWAHARRKFDEALKSMPEKARADSLALRAKQYCDQLFDLESKFNGLSADERFKKRDKQSKPLTEEFFRWLKTQNASAKSAFGVAANYVLGQQESLVRYLLDGRLEISNNRAERSIKPFVIGRKNFLFANTARGAKASAVMYSMIETAKENRLNPYAWLTYIFKTVPNLDMTDPGQLKTLLPGYAPESCKAPVRVKKVDTNETNKY
jgi:transposase